MRELQLGRWADKRLRVDAAVAFALWLVLSLLSGVLGSGTLVVAALQVLPLAWRRVAPLPSALAVAVGCLVQVGVLVNDGPILANVAVLIALYSAAAHATEGWQGLAVLALGYVGVGVATLDWALGGGFSGAGMVLPEILFLAVVLGMAVTVAWVLGDVVRRRRAVVARLRAQDEALARDETQRVRLAAQDERATIAREMHDIVAHSLSVVVVQADGGAYAARSVLDHDPHPAPQVDRVVLERAAQTLETVAATAREALADTRSLVGVLRERGRPADYAPQQGLAGLEELVQRLRDSGVPVGLAVRGDVTGLTREADLAAYRVVQESLTNVLKHAGPGARAEVDVLRSPGVLVVRVGDDGRGPGEHDGAGNGIVGMTERVGVLGGTLYAGARAGGGFEVVASIPVQHRGGEDGRV